VTEGTKKVVLIVDDEELFLDAVVDSFGAMASALSVVTAKNGRLAAELLATSHVDLVVTDLNMPELDGLGLIAHISRQHAQVPVIVMTAFGTPDVERELCDRGILRVIDKPIDLPRLVDLVLETLAVGTSGHLAGIGMPTFLQLVEMERKTCTVRVQSAGRVGSLYLRRGTLAGAQTSFLEGAEAATEIVCWEHAEIDLLPGPMPKLGDTMLSISEILMNAFRLLDERRRDRVRHEGDGPPSARSALRAALERPELDGAAIVVTPVSSSQRREEIRMSTNEKLKELASVDGFKGAALFTPKGELLAQYGKDVANLEEIGILANNVLMNAQQASLDMGTGRGQQVHVEAENATILVRCLNEGTDPLASQPGKAHVHLVYVLDNTAPIGLAKLRLGAAIQKVAEDFRF
jgi:CheY-like chemotaxis protein